MSDPHFDPARLNTPSQPAHSNAYFDPEAQHRKRHWAWAIGIAVLMALVIIGLNLWQRSSTPATPTPTPTPAPTPAPTPEPTPTPAAEAVIEHPVPPVPPPTPLPALADSDTLAQQALAGLVGSALVKESFNTEQLIRRIVVTVDNLTRPKMTQRQSPLKPVAGSFSVTSSGTSSGTATTISPDNARRYEPWVQVFSKLNMRQVASLYRQFYPLFQSAYEELGYPKAYFNDRLIAVIDHLLATPPAPAAAALVQPKVLYEYADPELEARSSGQKILLRLSPAQALKVKAKLKELRAQVAKPITPSPAVAPQ